MLQQLLRVGIYPENGPIRNRMILLHNKLMWGIAIFAMCRLTWDLFNFTPEGLYMSTGVLALGLSGIEATRRGFFQVAKVSGVVFFFIFVSVVKLCFGSAIGIDFTIPIIFAFVVFFFRNRTNRVIIFVSYITSFVSITMYTTKNGVLYPHIEGANSLYHYFLIAGTALLFFVFYAIITEREAYQLETDRLLKAQTQSQVELQVQKEELQIVNGDLERFVYMASHDLKSPLRNVNNFVKLIQRKVSKLEDPDLDKYIDVVTSGTEKMQTLITGILDHSKIIQPDNIPVDMNEVLNDVRDNLQEIIESRNATIIVPRLPSLNGDKAQFVMLFQNLVQNGIKYNKSNSPIVKIGFARKEVDDQSYLQFRIADNGIGIAADYHKQIFQMFSRLHSDSQYQGNGIGLATCKRIMEKSDGRIEIESEESQGSTFILRWPLEKLVQMETIEATVLS